MASRSNIATKARKRAEADFATWLMMAKLGGFDGLPPTAQSFLIAYQGRLIFNLGHGIQPETPIAHVDQMLRRVRAYQGLTRR